MTDFIDGYPRAQIFLPPIDGKEKNHLDRILGIRIATCPFAMGYLSEYFPLKT